MVSAFCQDCRREVTVVLDYAAGDMVCTECGLVLESHYIEESSEWRTFSDDNAADDPSRVGAPTNALLVDNLSTTISDPKGLMQEAKRQSHVSNQGDRALIVGFDAIADMADRLGLVPHVKDAANELYKAVRSNHSLKGRGLESVLAACVFLACRSESKPRTVKEVLSILSGSTTLRDLKRAINMISKLHVDKGQEAEAAQQQQPKMTGGFVCAADFVNRFCSSLNMSSQEMRATAECAKRLSELDVRRSPVTLAAAVIYLISLLVDERKSLLDIASNTGVAAATIKNAFASLRPHATQLVPEWFCKPNEVAMRLAKC